MTLWDLLLVYLLSKLFGGKEPIGPTWPVPPGREPPGGGPPVPPGQIPPIPPVEIPPFEVPPGNIPPWGEPPGITAPGGTVWKGYYYLQPDAGQAYGTPYGLAEKWTGKGANWTQMYNATRGRPLANAPDKRYAEIADKLLIPFSWPETTEPKILARITPIPVGTVLPGVEQAAKLSGDEDARTI